MGASACPDFAFAKPAPRNRVKRVKVRDEKNHDRKVCSAVDKRDKNRCVLTGRRGSTTTVDPLDKLHHHHILQRGRDLGVTETWNITTVHSVVHDLIHENVLTVSGNADERLAWTIKATAVEECFGRKRVPAHVRVVAAEDWLAYIKTEARIR